MQGCMMNSCSLFIFNEITLTSYFEGNKMKGRDKYYQYI